MHLPATHSSPIYDSTYKSVRKSDKDFIIAFISSSFVQYVIMMIRCQQGFCIDASSWNLKLFSMNQKDRTTIDLLVGFIPFNHSTALNLLHFITKILMLLTTMTNRQLHGFEWDEKKKGMKRRMFYRFHLVSVYDECHLWYLFKKYSSMKWCIYFRYGRWSALNQIGSIRWL